MRRRAALASLALALAGCGAWQGVKSRLPPRQPQPGPHAGAYAELRDAATRRATLYDGFVSRATVSATWLSAPVREAATRRLAEWQGWGAAELEAALQAGRAEAGGQEEFLVALYTSDRSANDLDLKGSTWRLILDDGATQVNPGRVERIRADATLAQLYPFIGPFDEVYRVKVPWAGPPLSGRTFFLRLRSAIGALDLDFGPDGLAGERPWLAP